MSRRLGWFVLLVAFAACSSSSGSSSTDAGDGASASGGGSGSGGSVSAGSSGSASSGTSGSGSTTSGGSSGSSGSATSGGSGSDGSACPNAQQKAALEAFIRSTAVDGDVFAHVLVVQKSSVSGGQANGFLGVGFSVPLTTFGFPEPLSAHQGTPQCTNFTAGSASGCAYVTTLASDSVIANAYLQPMPVSLSGATGDVLVSLAMQSTYASDNSGGATTTQNVESWQTELILTPPGMSKVHVLLSGSLSEMRTNTWPLTWQLNVKVEDADDGSWPVMSFFGGATSQQTQGNATVVLGSVYASADTTGPKLADWSGDALVWTGACQ